MIIEAYFNVQCQTLNEEEIFEIQDKGSLFQLGWIHVSVLIDFYEFIAIYTAGLPVICNSTLQIIIVEVFVLIYGLTDTGNTKSCS